MNETLRRVRPVADPTSQVERWRPEADKPCARQTGLFAAPVRRVRMTWEAGYGWAMRRAIFWLLVFSIALTPVVGASEVPPLKAGVAASDGRTSVVLTPDGVKRQLSGMRAVSPSAQVQQDGDDRTAMQGSDAPTWSTGKALLLGLATQVACNALGRGCGNHVSYLSASPPLTPPGWEPWRRAGCTAPNTCPAWTYSPP